MAVARRVGVVHPMFTTRGVFHGGGGEAVCAHVLEALQDDYEVTLLTFDSVNLEEMNLRFGTALSPDRIQIRLLSYPPGLAPLLQGHTTLNGVTKNLAAQQARRLRHKYDLLISTYNEMDLGEPGLQYIHFPDMALWLPPELESALARRLPVRWVRRRALAVMSGFSYARMKRNKTLVNSRWTKRLVHQVHGIDAEVLYPPLRFDFPKVPWEQKEPGFVCVGRLFPNKRVHVIIEIVRQLRMSGIDTHLHIIGSLPDPEYGAEILRLCERHKDWCTYEGAPDRLRLVELLARHRFGIHAMEHEHFGIAVAEMAAAGAVVFIPAGGGQTEIVPFPELQYTSVEDAVAKVAAVFRDPVHARELHERLQRQMHSFSPTYFASRVRELVADALAHRAVE